jgi:hypothetical protein
MRAAIEARESREVVFISSSLAKSRRNATGDKTRFTAILSEFNRNKEFSDSDSLYFMRKKYILIWNSAVTDTKHRPGQPTQERGTSMRQIPPSIPLTEVLWMSGNNALPEARR